MKDASTCASISMCVGVISIPKLSLVKEIIEDGIELDIHISDNTCLLLNSELFEFV